MSKQTINRQYEISPSGQLVIVLSSTKYTYANFTEFHETVLDILDNNDLSDLSKAQMEHAVLFINMVLGLLDAPTKNAVVQKRKSRNQVLPGIEESGHNDNIKSTNATIQNAGCSNSIENFQKLLKWIDEVVLLKRITVEKMLDEFYSLGIVQLKL